MASKLTSNNSPELSNVVVNAILSILEKSNESDQKFKVDIDNIKVKRKQVDQLETLN